MKKLVSSGRISDKSAIVFLFLTAFFLHVLFNPISSSLNSLPTELMTLSFSSHLAGYDWSSVAGSSSYYGTGFYVLFTPLFYVFHNASMLHQAILAVVCLIASIPACICYQVMTKYLKIDNKLFCLTVSLTVSFFTVSRTNIAMNEHALILILWLLILLTAKHWQTNNNKLKILYSILIAILLGYSYTIHTRALTFAIAYIAAVFLMWFVLKKKIINILPFIITLCISYFLANLYIKYVTSLIWHAEKTESMRNSVSTLGIVFDNFSILFSVNGIKGFLNIILGQSYAAIVYSAGIAAVIIAFAGYYVFHIIRLKRRGEPVSFEEELLFFIIIICMISVIMTILAHGFISLKGAAQVVTAGDGARSYYFLRYFYIYLSPLFMFVMVYIYLHTSIVKRLYGLAVSVFLLLSAYNMAAIMPATFSGNVTGLDNWHYFSPYCLRTPGNVITCMDYCVVLFVIFLLLVLFYIAIRNNKLILLSVIMLVFVAYAYIYSVFGISFYSMNRSYDNINSFVEFFDRNHLGDSVGKICVNLDSSASGYVLQFELLDISVELDDFHNTDAVIMLSNTIDSQYDDIRSDFFITQLDDNEYIWIKNGSANQYEW